MYFRRFMIPTEICNTEPVCTGETGKPTHHPQTTPSVSVSETTPSASETTPASASETTHSASETTPSASETTPSA